MVNDIFVSYRRKNVDFVKQVVSALEAQGKSLWVDWDDIPPGVASFSNEIERGIDGAHIFLAVLSPDYLQSDHCLSELEHAAQLNKRIIPIIHEKFDGYAIPKSIQLINWIYFVPHAGQTNDFYSAIGNVLQAIDADYDHIQEHTRQLQRALEWQNAEKNSGFLLRGKALVDAETWLAKVGDKDPAPASLHTEFILASRRGEAQRQRRLLIGTSVLLTIALIALVVAVQQFFMATRRADETLSILIANDAVNALAVDDPLTAISRAYYANTFIDNPPEAVQSILQNIAFQPAPRYVIENTSLGLPEVGMQIPINNNLYLQQDSLTDLTIRNPDESILTHFRVFTVDSRNDSDIHPNVMENIQDIQNNTLLPNGGGYDISPDGTLVAMGREGVGLIIWQNDASATVLYTHNNHELIIDNVQFSEDGQYLVSKASTQQMINFTRSDVEYFIWDTSTWQVIQRISSFDNTSELLAISDEARFLLFYTYGSNQLTVWDSANVTTLWQVALFDFVQDLAFTNDGQHLIVSSVITRRMAPPDTLRVYDVTRGVIQADYNGLDGNHMIGLPILRGDNPDTLRVIDNDGSVNTLNILTGDETTIGTIPILFSNGISENGRYIATEDFDTSQLAVFDLETASDVGSIPMIGFIRNVSISADGQTVAYTSEDPDTGAATLLVYDVSSQTEVTRFNNVIAGFSVRAHLFSSDNHFIYADNEQIIHIIEMQNWQEIRQLTGFLEQVNDMEYVIDAQALAVSGMNGSVIVWDTTTGLVTFQLSDVGSTANVALAPSGDILATGNEDGVVTVWRIFDANDALKWVEENRVILPLSCADRASYGLNSCE